ncbi:MAG: hypothetical protein EOP93_25125 [Lysobacteraceae bacterium]|nr:MAG: hypothetical protein EOP93_25125 [Xanthomonadaceae bacterium]
MQLLLATPVLLVAMAIAAWRGLRDPRPAARYLACSGAMIVLGFLALSFFADRQRASFHWPLPGYVALIPLLPAVLAGWPRAWRRMAWASAAACLAGVLAFHVAGSVPSLRQRTAGYNFHPTNFAGWDVLPGEVRSALAAMPPGTRLLAGDFKIGAELGFAFGDAAIPVLDHPLNHAHGRAPQLASWALASDALPGHGPWLLVASATHVKFRALQAYYQRLCAQVGPLPPPRVLDVDHGRQRFLLFAFEHGRRAGPCTTPALAYLDTPGGSAHVAPTFEVAGC